jgi:hypothetical protein
MKEIVCFFKPAFIQVFRMLEITFTHYERD